MSKVRRFEVTAAGDFSSVLAALTDHLGLRLLSLDEVERTWLDTPSGDLNDSGSTLEFRRPYSDATPSLTWSTDGRVVVHDPCVSTTLPSGASTLPVSAAFARLASLVGEAEFVPGPTANSRIAVLASLDDEEKTTARVVLDRSETIDGVVLPMALELLPLRGYESECSALEKSLKRIVALAAMPRTMRELVGQASEATAKGLSSSVTLVPSMSAASAWRAVFRNLSESMTQSFSGVLNGDDPEDLHAFRVAVRRLRTILQDGVDVIDVESRDRFRREYRWLGDVTTPTRDADVHLIEFPVLAAALPDEHRRELNPFIDVLRRHRLECQQQMVIELRSIRRAEFGTAWMAFLDNDDVWTGCGDLADRPVMPIVLSRIEKAHRQLVKNGRRITKKSPPILLHELRKEGKRLRYLLECFSPLLDHDALHDVLPALKDLQDVLGEYQDTEVQAAALLALAGEREGAEAGFSMPALIGVIEQLRTRGTAARAAFAKSFADFDSRKVKRSFDQLEPRPTSSRKSSGKKKR